ncbi:hypothetical protein QQF64_006922 [Cirrhinus molitorella]|uniref:Uncharacterized protein n=1 Tax=Cirrhinus molitorella TaxID=172907 RepID=A0ABR3MCL4_9TELE
MADSHKIKITDKLRNYYKRLEVTRDESELLEDDVVSLTSSDPGASALLGSTQEEQEMSEGEEAEAEPSQTSCPAYEELLEVMDRATVGGVFSALQCVDMSLP